MIAGYQRTVARGEFCGGGEPCWVTKLYQYRYGWALALALPSGLLLRLTGSLIFFSSSLLAVLFPFPSRPRNAHDFLLVFSSPSRVDLTVDHAPAVSVPFCPLPATPRSATSTLDVNPLF
jgi:hypothetical protein